MSLKTHITRQAEMWQVLACVQSSGTVVHAEYLEDIDEYIRVPLAGKRVCLKANPGETLVEGELILVRLGIKDDSRFGKQHALFGYAKFEGAR